MAEGLTPNRELPAGELSYVDMPTLPEHVGVPIQDEASSPPAFSDELIEMQATELYDLEPDQEAPEPRSSTNEHTRRILPGSTSVMATRRKPPHYRGTMLPGRRRRGRR